MLQRTSNGIGWVLAIAFWFPKTTGGLIIVFFVSMLTKMYGWW